MHPRSAPANRLTLDWIRHGEPEGGVKYRGSVDDPLSATGWQQMRISVQQALDAGTRWDAIVSSPMLRCHAFASELAVKQDLPLSVLPDLREICFGDLEGLTPEQAWQQYPELLANIWQAPEQHSPPGGEPYPEFLARVHTGIQHILHQHQNRQVLIVAHGGVIRAMLSLCLNIGMAATFKMDVPYAGMTRTRVWVHQEQAEYSLQFLNGFRP